MLEEFTDGQIETLKYILRKYNNAKQNEKTNDGILLKRSKIASRLGQHFHGSYFYIR